MSETNHDWNRIMTGAKHGKHSNFNACAAEGTANTASAATTATDTADDNSSDDNGWDKAFTGVSHGRA